MMHVRRLLAAGFLALACLGAAPLASTPIDRLNLPWWRARHEEKLREAHAAPVDLVFLGDSITQNWEKSGPPAWQDFAPVWQRFYGARRPLNLGFGGDATSHLLWRIDHGEIDGIAPRLAVILIGANNMGRLRWPAQDTVAGITAVVQDTRQHLPHTHILLLSVLPSGRGPWVAQTTQAVNQALAREFGQPSEAPVPDVTFLDVTGVLAPGGAFDPTLFYDPLLPRPAPPLHPTAMAQERLAAFIEPTVARLMKAP